MTQKPRRKAKPPAKTRATGTVLPDDVDLNELGRAIGSFKPVNPTVLEALKEGFRTIAIPPEYVKLLRGTEQTYAARIEQARETATSAHALAEAAVDEPTSADRQLESTVAMQKEVARVAAIVAAMADSTTRLLEIAGDAEAGLITLSGVAEATREETVRLRSALEAGQKSADSAAARLVVATWVLVLLTVVLVALTIVLLAKERPTAAG